MQPEPYPFETPNESPTVPSHATCKREIESLHAFFVEWYTGEAPNDADERVERALAPDFEMVTPEGNRLERADVVEGIRENYATRESGGFEIEIRNVETRYSVDDRALVRYEEWQKTPNETTGRLSTALFKEDPDAPEHVVWLDLHETWLDDPNPDDG